LRGGASRGPMRAFRLTPPVRPTSSTGELKCYAVASRGGMFTRDKKALETYLKSALFQGSSSERGWNVSPGSWARAPHLLFILPVEVLGVALVPRRPRRRS